MGIRKKIFYITAAVMLSVLLVSYGVMYLYFYHVMFEETVIRQRASVELNRQTDMLPVFALLPEEEKAPVEAAVTDSDNAEGGDQA